MIAMLSAFVPPIAEEILFADIQSVPSALFARAISVKICSRSSGRFVNSKINLFVSKWVNSSCCASGEAGRFGDVS